MNTLLKTLVFTVLGSIAFAQTWQPQPFSAFTAKNVLYVTILSDNCNTLTGSLVINDDCRLGRASTIKPVCGATLQITSTRKTCPIKHGYPRVVTIDLNQTDIATQSDVLVLTHGNARIPVKINK